VLAAFEFGNFPIAEFFCRFLLKVLFWLVNAHLLINGKSPISAMGGGMLSIH
jgi:hypothetical protein